MVCSKEKKLLKTMKFPAEYQLKVDLPVIKWEAVKPWIAERTTELLGMEDEVLIAYIFEQLEGKQVAPLPIPLRRLTFYPTTCPRALARPSSKMLTEFLCHAG